MSPPGTDRTVPSRMSDLSRRSDGADSDEPEGIRPGSSLRPRCQRDDDAEGGGALARPLLSAGEAGVSTLPARGDDGAGASQLRTRVEPHSCGDGANAGARV